MSGTARLVPPLNDPPIDVAGDQHSRAWTDHFQDVADEIAKLTAKTGVVDGSDAPAGQVGEFMTATVGPVALTSTITANVASLSLTPGDWDVSGAMTFSASGGTAAAFGTGIAGIDTFIQATFPAGVVVQQLATPVRRENVTTATTVWIVARAFFSGSMVATGTIRARRAR